MLSHVLANNPRVGYAHQTNLIGPATVNGQDYGYTLLTLINNMLSQYNTWYNPRPARPDDRRHRGPDPRPSRAPGRPPSAGGQVTATETNGVVTVTNNGTGGRRPGHRADRHHRQRRGLRPALRRPRSPDWVDRRHRGLRRP